MTFCKLNVTLLFFSISYSEIHGIKERNAFVSTIQKAQMLILRMFLLKPNYVVLNIIRELLSGTGLSGKAWIWTCVLLDWGFIKRLVSNFEKWVQHKYNYKVSVLTCVSEVWGWMRRCRFIWEIRASLGPLFITSTQCHCYYLHHHHHHASYFKRIRKNKRTYDYTISQRKFQFGIFLQKSLFRMLFCSSYRNEKEHDSEQRFWYQPLRQF